MRPFRIPRVSVVIPLFDKAPYVQRALDSVFCQNLTEFEIIVIDDGSTDGAPQALATMTDPRLTIHRQANAGVSSARNRGITLARAPWVAFLDADDEWSPNFLESTVRIAEASPMVSAVFSNLVDHRAGRPLINRVNRTEFLLQDYFSFLLLNEGIGMSSSSVLASKAHLDASGGFPESVHHGEDIDLWARLAWSGEVAFCADAYAIWHSEVPNSASKNTQAAIDEYPIFLRSYEEWDSQGRIPQHLRASSRRYATWVLARHVMELAHHGRAAEAQARLGRRRWRALADVLLWKATIWVHLPADTLRMGRWLRRALRRSPWS